MWNLMLNFHWGALGSEGMTLGQGANDPGSILGMSGFLEGGGSIFEFLCLLPNPIEGRIWLSSPRKHLQMYAISSNDFDIFISLFLKLVHVEEETVLSFTSINRYFCSFRRSSRHGGEIGIIFKNKHVTISNFQTTQTTTKCEHTFLSLSLPNRFW